jgi:hypothetical protein
VDSTLVGAILQNAGVGCAIMVVLILTGVLDPARNTKRAEDEAAKWHTAWERGQETITELQRANAAQTTRADMAVEATQQLTAVFERLGVRNAAVEEGRSRPPPHQRRGAGG